MSSMARAQNPAEAGVRRPVSSRGDIRLPLGRTLVTPVGLHPVGKGDAPSARVVRACALQKKLRVHCRLEMLTCAEFAAFLTGASALQR